MGGAKIPEGVPISLGNLAWGCQILGGARFPMTPVKSPDPPSQREILEVIRAGVFGSAAGKETLLKYYPVFQVACSIQTQNAKLQSIT